MTVRPNDFTRRSFVHRRLTAAGARFTVIDGAAVAEGYHEEGDAERLGLADLSPLFRLGLRGAGAADRLAGFGLPAPDRPGSVERAANGALVARLADGELFILPDPGMDGERLPAHLAALSDDDCYAVPRRDSHAWFVLCGRESPQCLARLTDLDLRPLHRTTFGLAQTMVAGLPTVLILDAHGKAPLYHLLADSAAAEYLWDRVVEAMASLDGRPVGLARLRRLL